MVDLGTYRTYLLEAIRPQNIFGTSTGESWQNFIFKLRVWLSHAVQSSSHLTPDMDGGLLCECHLVSCPAVSQRSAIFYSPSSRLFHLNTPVLQKPLLQIVHFQIFLLRLFLLQLILQEGHPSTGCPPTILPPKRRPFLHVIHLQSFTHKIYLFDSTTLKPLSFKSSFYTSRPTSLERNARSYLDFKHSTNFEVNTGSHLASIHLDIQPSLQPPRCLTTTPHTRWWKIGSTAIKGKIRRALTELW